MAEALASIKTGDHPGRTAVFVVKGDGKELNRSKLLDSAGQEKIAVSVTGVQTLELVAEKGTGPMGHSWAVWGEPRVTRAE